MDALIKVSRKWKTDKSTIGELTFDELKCFTLEDPVRDGPKIPGDTAIPAGRYEVICNYSNRFGRLLPMIMNVPGFSGVRIHLGNRPNDTEGCILVGKDYDPSIPDVISNSRMAFLPLFEKIKESAIAGKVWIDIS